MREVEDSILNFFIDNECKEVRFDDIRECMVRKYNLPTFLSALSRLCERGILFQSFSTTYIMDIELFLKRVLRLRYKLSSTILCLFIYAYRKYIMRGDRVIVELNEVIKYYSYIDLCSEFLFVDKRIRRNAINELTNRGLLEVITYKVYRLNYEKLGRGLVKIILESTTTYNDIKIPDISC